MERFSSSVKKNCILSKESFSYILSIKNISYISEKGTLQFSIQALKMKELHSGNISYTSGNGNLEKNPYVSENGNSKNASYISGGNLQ